MSKRGLQFVFQGLALVLAVGLALSLSSPARADGLTDGLGTMAVSGGPVVASSTGNTLTFTYTADQLVGITAGTVQIALPSGWTAPQATDSGQPGYVSTDLLGATVSGASDGTITVSNVLLASGASFDITYQGATAPPTGGPDVFAVSESDFPDTPAPLVASPSLPVLAPDGSGAMVASPSSVSAGSTQPLTFTYTADPGGIQSGTVDVTVPSGWTVPQTGSSSVAGFVTTSLGSSPNPLDVPGSVSVQSGDVIHVTGVTLASGDTLLISYAHAPAPTAGSYTFSTSESSSGGATVALASQPQVTVTPVAPDAPTGLSVTPGHGQVQLSWSAPANDGGAGIDHYVINEYQGGDTSIPVGTSTSVGTSATIPSLANGQQYTFTVQAVNSVGAGTASDPQSVTLPAVAPGAPTSLSVTPGNGSAQLSWKAPVDDGGASIDHYVVSEYLGGDTSDLVGTLQSSGTSATASSLPNGQEYTFTVQAVNSAGAGAASDPQSATPVTVPGAPTGVSATPGNGSVLLSWTAPSADGGAGVDHYVINEYSGGDTSDLIGTIQSSGTSASVSSLSNGQPYTFTVVAVNTAGSGPASSSFTATPRTVPAAPALTATSGSGQVNLSWTTPADGGAGIEHYVINEYAGASATGTPTTVTATSTSQTVTGLTNGSTYTFEIQAVNAAGSGEVSNAETETPATVPGAPKLLATVAGPGLVEVVWSPPSENGGAPVTAYDIFRSTAPGAKGTEIATQAPGASPNTYIDQTVTNGTTYYYEVAAVNRAGESTASGQISAEPQLFLPSPLLVQTITVRGHKVTFSAPNQCIRAGRVAGKLTISASKNQRTRVLISKTVFEVGSLTRKTVAPRRASAAPVRVSLRAKRMATKHSYEFVARPSIAAGKGRPHTYSLRLRITAC